MRLRGLGVVPLEAPALGIHYLSAGGHKWLMGAEGTGVLYVDPSCAPRLRLQVASWLSHDEPRHDRASELDSWGCVDELVAEEDYSQEWGEAAPQ